MAEMDLLQDGYQDHKTIVIKRWLWSRDSDHEIKILKSRSWYC